MANRAALRGRTPRFRHGEHGGHTGATFGTQTRGATSLGIQNATTSAFVAPVHRWIPHLSSPIRLDRQVYEAHLNDCSGAPNVVVAIVC